MTISLIVLYCKNLESINTENLLKRQFNLQFGNNIRIEIYIKYNSQS